MTPKNRARKAGLAALVAALVACLTLSVPIASAKEQGDGAVKVTKTVNSPIPDEAPPIGFGVDGILRSTIEVGKQFKGRRIRDVNVTVQTLGTSPRSVAPFTGNTEAFDLVARLDAPNGAHTTPFANLLSSFNPMTMVAAPFPSIGPLTLDDEAALNLGVFNPHSPTELYAPYAGKARTRGTPLAVMDNGPVRGTWTLTMMDVINTGTSNLVSWRLKVVAGRPFETK